MVRITSRDVRLVSKCGAAQWLTTAFLLTMAVVIPITGFLLQRFNTRPIFLLAVSLFATGTAIAAISPNLWVLVFARIPLRIPAFIPLILWIGFQVVMFAAGGENQISWACHIGGIIAGAVLVLVLRSRGVPLFAAADEDIVAPAPDQPPVAPQPAASEPPATTARWGRGGASGQS